MGMFFPFAVCAVECRATVGSAVPHPGMGRVKGILALGRHTLLAGRVTEEPLVSQGLAFKGLIILSPGVGENGEWAWFPLRKDDLGSLFLLSWKFCSAVFLHF